MKKVFVCKLDQSSKQWGYEELGATDVKVSWGRIGLKPQEKVHHFSSPSERAAFVIDKVGEKRAKGYVEQEEQQVKQDAAAAQALGTQFKVVQMEYVEAKKGKFKILESYDPDELVLVEVLNSWSKEKCVLLLGRNDTQVARSVQRTNGNVILTGLSALNDKEFSLANSVRSYLKKLADRVAEQVVNVIAHFGGLGRRIATEDGQEYRPLTQAALVQASGTGRSLNVEVEDEVISSIKESSVDASVIRKFCGLGNRRLQI